MAKFLRIDSAETESPKAGMLEFYLLRGTEKSHVLTEQLQEWPHLDPRTQDVIGPATTIRSNYIKLRDAQIEVDEILADSDNRLALAGFEGQVKARNKKLTRELLHDGSFTISGTVEDIEYEDARMRLSTEIGPVAVQYADLVDAPHVDRKVVIPAVLFGLPRSDDETSFQWNARQLPFRY